MIDIRPLTAIRHIGCVEAATWLRRGMGSVDPSSDADVSALAPGDGHLVISASVRIPVSPGQVVYSLASWTKDDVIEYLLAAHWDRCPSVMTRLKANDDRAFLKGIPALWTVVLDRMAGDESIQDVRAALRRDLAERFKDSPRAQTAAEGFCLTAVCGSGDPVHHVPFSTLPDKTPEQTLELTRLMRHRPVALLLAASRIKDLAQRGLAQSAFSERLPYDLIQEAAAMIAGNDQALQNLGEWLRQDAQFRVHPMAASLLHASVPGWRPPSDCRPRLTGAHLRRAAWPGLNLAGVDLESADLREADLSLANLTKSCVRGARLERADLRAARLDTWVAVRADLSCADLRSVNAPGGNFYQANLGGARLMEANLWKANLQEANIDGADFTGANLEDAELKGLKLRLARFDYARFGGADLRECDLEDMVLTVPDFHDADLRSATMTGSRMQEANFLGANLRGARLAEIDWPGADLHDADLRWASFHLGSSRSGLVGSPIACEGSRTGYYTDDYDEQDVKPPEEIRKANLRGADLRGANIEGVDFYLVDLRDASYTRDQAEHFWRCRAILRDCAR